MHRLQLRPWCQPAPACGPQPATIATPAPEPGHRRITFADLPAAAHPHLNQQVTYLHTYSTQICQYQLAHTTPNTSHTTRLTSHITTAHHTTASHPQAIQRPARPTGAHYTLARSVRLGFNALSPRDIDEGLEEGEEGEGSEGEEGGVSVDVADPMVRMFVFVVPSNICRCL